MIYWGRLSTLVNVGEWGTGRDEIRPVHAFPASHTILLGDIGNGVRV